MVKENSMSLLFRVFKYIEDGKLIGFVYGIVFVFLSAMFFFSEIRFQKESTVTYTPVSTKHHVVKKVSSLPQEKNDGEESTATEEGNADEIARIRQRYISYVVSEIEKNKVYPPKEQGLGHEGAVKFILEISSDGTVSRFSFVNKCIYSALNTASINAVKKANPFTGFPPQLKEKKLRVPVLMDYYIE